MFDPVDAIRLLVGLRNEKFTFEANIALLTLSVWLIYPHRPEIVRHANVTSLAHLLILLDNGDIRVSKRNKIDYISACNKLLSPKTVADVILKREVWSFTDELIELDWTINDAISIAYFLTSAPPEAKPSFNKAMHFISSGGFGDSAADTETNPPSISTLKESWARLAISSPFLLAADVCDCGDLWKLAPDNPLSFEASNSFLNDGDSLEATLSTARYIQEAMIKRLGSASLKRFSFISFPPEVRPERPEFSAMEDWQLAIIESYKAPKPY